MEPTPEKYLNPFTDYGFKRLFGQEPSKDLLLDFLAELAKLSPQEYREYEDSVNNYRDIKNSIDWAEEKGRQKEKLDTAARLIEAGMDDPAIAAITLLDLEAIRALRKSMGR